MMSSQLQWSVFLNDLDIVAVLSCLSQMHVLPFILPAMVGTINHPWK